MVVKSTSSDLKQDLDFGKEKVAVSRLHLLETYPWFSVSPVLFVLDSTLLDVVPSLGPVEFGKLFCIPEQ